MSNDRLMLAFVGLPSLTVEDAPAVLRAIDAAYQSAGAGRRSP